MFFVTGICGNARIVDIGGPKFLTPLPDLSKLYTFKQIAEAIQSPGSFMLGVHHVMHVDIYAEMW